MNSRSKCRLFSLISLALVSNSPADSSYIPVDDEYYTYACWPNGWRNQNDSAQKNIFAIEGSAYDLAINLSDFQDSGFRLKPENSLSYEDAVSTGMDHLKKLPNAGLAVEISSNGRTFTANACQAGTAPGGRQNTAAWMWESARYVDYYEFKRLEFYDEQGEAADLGLEASLHLVAWPESFSLSTDILRKDFNMKDGPMKGVVGSGFGVLNSPIKIEHSDELEHEEFTAECWLMIPKGVKHGRRPTMFAKNKSPGEEGYFGVEAGKGYQFRGVMTLANGETHVTDWGGNKMKRDEFAQVALSYDSHTLKLYVNGKLVASNEIGEKRKSVEGRLVVGNRPAKPRDPYTGIYDEIRIWNRALSEDEVKTQFDSKGNAPAQEGLTFERTFNEFPVPPEKPEDFLEDAQVRIVFKGDAASGLDLTAEKKREGAWNVGDREHLTATYEIPGSTISDEDVSINLEFLDSGQQFPAEPHPKKGCLRSLVNGLERPIKRGGKGLEGYDDFIITVDNQSDEDRMIPYLVEYRNPQATIGIVPIICDLEGRPLGIHMQLSKNWHFGRYFMGYTVLPAKPGKTQYMLRFAYGFYGDVPATSHSQLSLVGWGGNGRWDQLAIGAWAEIICFNPDQALSQWSINDIRTLMSVNPRYGKYAWTAAGNTANWLCSFDHNNEWLVFKDIKTSYLAQGPCLTDVVYHGHYGPRQQAEFDARVYLSRTDDYSRTVFEMEYTFKEDMSAEDTSFFALAMKNNNFYDGKVSIGNKAGLLEEKEFTLLEVGTHLYEKKDFNGEAPWWVSYPERVQKVMEAKPFGGGISSFIIRSYEATFSGKTYTSPTVSMPVMDQSEEFNKSLIGLRLTAPQEVETIKAGDTVRFKAVLPVVHMKAEDYYGPNEIYRNVLKENGRSYKTIYREAVGNTMDIQVEGGHVLNDYPIIIETNSEEVEVDIVGGVGFVPVRFENVKSIEGKAIYEKIDGKLVKLDQTMEMFKDTYQNDYWQTDYDPDSKTYHMVYNIPLDGKPNSSWVFK